MKTITQKIQNIEKIVKSLDKRVRFIENNFATKDDLKNFATKDDIRLIIDHIDAFFVRDNRIKIVETTMHKHEERLTLLEQR